MRINPISEGNCCFRHYSVQDNFRKAIIEEPPKPDTFENKSNISFKGDKGALKGVFCGALTGAVIAAITVATGGLAAVVAAVGTTGTIVGGAAAGTHLGGIIGGLSSDE